MTLPDWYVTGGVMAFGWAAGPPLAVCLVLGIAGAIFQTATQIREAAITFVPKAIGVLLLLTFAGGLMLHQIGAYTERVFQNIPGMIHVRGD